MRAAGVVNKKCEGAGLAWHVQTPDTVAATVGYQLRCV
jgi:hypothetical protein